MLAPQLYCPLQIFALVLITAGTPKEVMKRL